MNSFKSTKRGEEWKLKDKTEIMRRKRGEFKEIVKQINK